MCCCSSIVGDLLIANKAVLVLGSSGSLDSPVPSDSESSVVAVSKWGTFDSGNEYIVGVISLTKKFKHFGILIVTNSFQDHVVSFLKSNVPYILHSLYEWDSFSKCFLSLLLQMLSDRMLVINVITSPEVHAEHPCQ